MNENANFGRVPSIRSEDIERKRSRNHGMTEIKIEMRSFKSNENILKKEDGSYYVVSANKASSVTLQSPINESQRKHTTILRISNR